MPGVKRRRDRSESAEDFTVEVTDPDGDTYTTLYHRRSKKSYIVAQPDSEYKVRATIKPSAWDLHSYDWYFCKLMVDDRYIRGRFLQRPRGYHGDVEHDVTWEFTTMQGGYALKFASRDKGRSELISEGDKNVGRIQVMFMAAETKTYFRERRFDDRRRHDDEHDDYNEPGQFAKEKVNQRVKETISFLRTVRGERIENPRRGGGGGGGGAPATVVNNYVYASIVVHYDTPEHLRFRGILRPQSIQDHRQFFPDEDFRAQMRQRVQAQKRDKRVVGDLTDDSAPITWSTVREAAGDPSPTPQNDRAADQRQRERARIRRNRTSRRQPAVADHEEPEDGGPVRGAYINLTADPVSKRTVARKRQRTSETESRRIVHVHEPANLAVEDEEEEPWEGGGGEDDNEWEAVDY